MRSHALSVTAFAGSVLAAVPTVNLPLHFAHGDGFKIATSLVDPHSNRSIEVVVDQGSENFWVFGPDSISNWGCWALTCQGPCNVTVQPFYDYPNSPTASKPVPFRSYYSYGANTKFITGDVAVNDSLLFVSDAGVSSTVDTRVAISSYMQTRMGDLSGGQCDPIPYDHGILGTAPFYRTPAWNTTGPHVRQELLERGVIDAPVQSMWFDEAPDQIEETFTGNAIFGGVDHSKYSGDLVKMNMVENDIGFTLGYYVRAPVVMVNNVAFDNYNGRTNSCLVDSGNSWDELPLSSSDRAKFAETAGLTYDDLTGVMAFNGSCDSIPKDTTIDLQFTGIDNKKVTVKIPLRTYARSGVNPSTGLCRMSVGAGDCVLGAPFSTAAFFAADDAANVVAFAQGGVSKRGSKPDADSISVDIP